MSVADAKVTQEIRWADAGDLPALLDLYHEVSRDMEGTPYDCCWRRDFHPSDEMIERFVHEGGMLVATVDGELAAAVGLDHDLGRDYGISDWLVDASEDEVVVLHILTVRRAYRGRGLSRRLLRASLADARERGMRSARLDVTYNNVPAFALYESEGFAHVGGGYLEIGDGEDPNVWLEVLELDLRQ